MINESQGDSPAFLQINQNGRTPTSATIMATMKIIISSGIPMGPMATFLNFGTSEFDSIRTNEDGLKSWTTLFYRPPGLIRRRRNKIS